MTQLLRDSADQVLSFWRLCSCSPVDSFSSAKSIRFHSWLGPRLMSWRHCCNHMRLFLSVRKWNLWFLRLETELLPGHSSHWSVADVCFTGDSTHRYVPVSFNSLFHEMPVPGSIARAFSSFSWRVAIIIKLLKLLDCFWNYIFTYHEQTTMPQWRSLKMQLQNSVTFVWHSEK